MFSHTHQIVLKVTRGCNLACKYCYVFDKPEYNNEEMTDEVFDYIMRRWMSETSRNDLDLVFHGGEPLRIGKQKFSRFCKKAILYAAMYGKSLSICIQTNSTLIDEEWAAIFKLYKVHVGVSWDGLNPSVDMRNNTGKLVFEKLKFLNSRGVTANPLMVIQKGNIDSLEENLTTLLEAGINSIKINRGVDVVEADASKSTFELSADELVDAFARTLRFMRKNPSFRDFGVASVLQGWLDPEDNIYELIDTSQAHCGSRFCGGMRNLMELEPDGTFMFCGRQSVRKDSTTGGSVFDKDVLELASIAKQWSYQYRKIASINAYRCTECHAQHICDGGCISYQDQKTGKPTLDSTTHQYFRKLNLWLLENNEEVQAIVKELRQYCPDCEVK